MKYGVLYSLIAILFLVVYAVTPGSWFHLLVWPAISFGIVASAYLGLGPRVFGKRPNGTMSVVSMAVLFPFILGLWAVWHLRLASREPAHNRLVENILIGRRLLSRELPPDVDVVVDLTCEFIEPRGVRNAARYISCPILDALSPDPQTLIELIRELALIDGRVFIHCAHGHGRTGLVAALLLIATKNASTVDGAIDAVKSARPRVGLNRKQMKAVQNAAAEMMDAGYDRPTI